MPWIAAVCVTSGLAIWKPVEFSPLTNFMGGYAWARYWHFMAMAAIVFIALGHIFMVFAVDPYSLRSMLTGGYNEKNSPEARNARPFYHLLPRKTDDG
jgi:thiosulfate reductase cytochrome b subunit